MERVAGREDTGRGTQAAGADGAAAARMALAWVQAASLTLPPQQDQCSQLRESRRAVREEGKEQAEQAVEEEERNEEAEADGGCSSSSRRRRRRAEAVSPDSLQDGAAVRAQQAVLVVGEAAPLGPLGAAPLPRVDWDSPSGCRRGSSRCSRGGRGDWGSGWGRGLRGSGAAARLAAHAAAAVATEAEAEGEANTQRRGCSAVALQLRGGNDAALHQEGQAQGQRQCGRQRRPSTHLQCRDWMIGP